MSSPSKIIANRANSKLSTGPTSTAGRLRASRNARRHGLNVPVLLDPDLVHQVNSLALKLAQDFDGVDATQTAYKIAEAEIDLRRVRKVKEDFLGTPIRSYHSTEGGAPELLEQILRLDRYERRALARRKSAIRQLTSYIEMKPEILSKICKTKPKKPTISKEP